MYNNTLVNMPAKFNPQNLGFHLSPDITIEYVQPKTKQMTKAEPPVQFPVNDSSTDMSNDDEDCDPYFSPLTFCTIAMDEDDNNEEWQQNKMSDSTENDDCASKVSKKPKTILQSNENSSFVCNGMANVSDNALASVKPRKRHSCHLCPKTFGWTTDLKRHILIHTGERPFKCTLCSATFTRNFLLKKHKTKMHQCLSPAEVSQLDNSVAKNVLEIKQKMRDLEIAKNARNSEEY